jgi:hypothetical protein
VAPDRLQFRCKRAATLCLCAVLALTLAGVNAPVAISAGLGGGNALSELTQRGQETTTTPTTTTTAKTESSSNSSTVIILALVAAIALLVGIAYLIMRDARRVAPVPEGQFAEGSAARDSAARLQQRRAKAKAARRQRKRNR